MSDIAAVGEKRVFEPFDKEAFKKEILNNIKYLFRNTPETASQQEIFQAVAYASKDMIIDEWLNAHKEYEKQDAKTVYYPVYGVPDGPCPGQQPYQSLLL